MITKITEIVWLVFAIFLFCSLILQIKKNFEEIKALQTVQTAMLERTILMIELENQLSKVRGDEI